jgi:hypothetical protein
MNWIMINDIDFNTDNLLTIEIVANFYQVEKI